LKNEKKLPQKGCIQICSKDVFFKKIVKLSNKIARVKTSVNELTSLVIALLLQLFFCAEKQNYI